MVPCGTFNSATGAGCAPAPHGVTHNEPRRATLSDTAKRYATALFETVRGDDALQDRLRADLAGLSAVGAEAAFRRFVANPRITPEDKARVLDQVAGRLAAAEPTRRLLALLAANDRAGLIGAVADAFGRLVDAARGREAVTVTAAFDLPADLKGRVETRLRALLGAGTLIRHRSDPGALGGLVVQIGSKVFDYSIRHHLARLRQAI